VPLPCHGVPMGATRRQAAITRDLSGIYEGFRRDKRGLGKRGTVLGEVSQGARLLAGDGDPIGLPDTTIEMEPLPPQWVEAAEEAREEIQKIKEKTVLLIKAQNKRSLKVFDDDSAPDKDVQAYSIQIAQHIRRCEQSIHQVKTRGAVASGKDREFRENMQRNLATQLQQLSQTFRQDQKAYANKIAKGQSVEVDWNGGGSSTSYAIDTGFTDQQLLEADDMEGQINQRSEEITQIASSVSDLNTIFKELAVLVIDQGSILDRIDYNIEQVVHKSRDANTQLQKAEKSQKSQRAMKCLLLLVVANLVLLIILIVKART